MGPVTSPSYQLVSALFLAEAMLKSQLVSTHRALPASSPLSFFIEADKHKDSYVAISMRPGPGLCFLGWSLLLGAAAHFDSGSKCERDSEVCLAPGRKGGRRA